MLIYANIITTITTTTTQCKLQSMCAYLCLSTSVNVLVGTQSNTIHQTAQVAGKGCVLVNERNTTSSASCRKSRPSWAHVGERCCKQMQFAHEQDLVRAACVLVQSTFDCCILLLLTCAQDSLDLQLVLVMFSCQ